MLPGNRYSERDYLQDDQRIQSQLQKIEDRIAEVEREIGKVRQAKLDEAGIKHFCQIAANNLDKMDDSQWRLLLEAMQLRVMVIGKKVNVEGVVPIPEDDVALQPCQASHTLS